MNKQITENNIVKLSGIVSSEPVVTHELEGEKFWEFLLETKRLSGTKDVLPITVPEKLLELSQLTLKEGMALAIEGEFRSYNKLVDQKSKLILCTFAKTIKEIEVSEVTDENSISLTGFICKQPIYRTTPFNREICDAILAVNRKNFKSDYLPLISWGRNAKYLENLTVGTKIEIDGRIQSRNYTKLVDGVIQERTAYEVSVQKLNNLAKAEDSFVRA
jgi:single-stranded DNA-binding protein